MAVNCTVWYAAKIRQRSLRLFVAIDVGWHALERIHACSFIDFPILVRKTAGIEHCIERPVSHEIAEASIFVH